MGRSVAQVTQSLRNSFQNINPSLDLLVGPTWDYTMAPVPLEIATAEAAVTNLQVYYSPNFPAVATPQQARDFATNFGISVSQGEVAIGPVVFYRYTPPPAGATIVIPVGQIVGTLDLQFLYQVVESKTMLGDFAATYYNPVTQRYEITVLVQAVLPGSIYNIPANRLVRILSGVQNSFNGVSQTSAMTGGTDPETSSDLTTRVIQQFKGINLNSVTGLQTLASRFLPTQILDSHVVRPSDRLEFQRPTSGPAIDLCLAGADVLVFSEEYAAAGGETSVPMQTSTAVSVTQVQVNNQLLDASLWTFLPDTTPAYQGSTRAKNTIGLVNPLSASDVVNISGTQNFLLDQLQAVVSPSGDAIFQTDVLVRSFVKLPVTVGVNVRLYNTLVTDTSDALASLTSTVQSYVEQLPIAASLDAGTLAGQIKAAIPNVESVQVYQFGRTLDAVTAVETIQPLKNQQPVFDVASSSLAVTS